MNDKLDEILRKLNLIEARLDILETAMFGLDEDEDILVDLADVENEDDEEIKQHNETM